MHVQEFNRSKCVGEYIFFPFLFLFLKMIFFQSQAILRSGEKIFSLEEKPLFVPISRHVATSYMPGGTNLYI